MARLDGRVAIVTGGAQGIGETYAKGLAGEGAKVVIADILDGSRVVDEIKSTYQGAEAIDVPTDITDEAAVNNMVARTIETFGKVDILVNNAALFVGIKHGPFEDITVDEWDHLMAVNIKGSWLCAKAAVAEMRKQKYGKIINISSGTAFKGAPGMLHYVTSKGAILAFTRSLSREVGDDGICVNTIAPGYTMSDGVLAGLDEVDNPALRREAQWASRAIKRDEEPEDLIGTLLFLCSADSDFMTGQCLNVDGGSVNN